MLTPKRSMDPELLDLPSEVQDNNELQGSLLDIRQVNLWLGGISSAIRGLDLILDRMAAREAGSTGKSAGESVRELKLLDIAAGSGDVTAALVTHAKARGYRPAAVAADLNFNALRHARDWNHEFHEISYALADGLVLPFPDGSFDVVHCSLVLHHLTEEDAVSFLREMARVSRFAVIAGDLRRNHLPWALIWLISRLFTRNKYTRYDGPLSVLRSFTPREMTRLAETAGFKNFKINRRRFWRMSLAGFI